MQQNIPVFKKRMVVHIANLSSIFKQLTRYGLNGDHLKVPKFYQMKLWCKIILNDIFLVQTLHYLYQKVRSMNFVADGP